MFSDHLLTVPTPSVTVFSPTGTKPYADSRFTLHCMIQLNQVIDSPVTFSVSWRKSGVPILNTSRITVYDVAPSGSHTYLSVVVFSTLSMTLDSGQYSCEASLSASPPSPFITGSPAATSTSYPLWWYAPVSIIGTALSINYPPSTYTQTHTHTFIPSLIFTSPLPFCMEGRV